MRKRTNTSNEIATRHSKLDLILENDIERMYDARDITVNRNQLLFMK